MSGMRFTPKGHGGHRRDADRVKRDGLAGTANVSTTLRRWLLTLSFGSSVCFGGFIQQQSGCEAAWVACGTKRSAC